jgi:hypothetical protein
MTRKHPDGGTILAEAYPLVGLQLALHHVDGAGALGIGSPHEGRSDCRSVAIDHSGGVTEHLAGNATSGS